MSGVYGSVYLKLDLRFEDKALNAVTAYKLFNPSNNSMSYGERSGFGGVIVYHGAELTPGQPYHAYDAACPHEATRNVTVQVQKDGIHAICPQCKSKYELFGGLGVRIEGPSQYDLTVYRVEMQPSGQDLIITNR